MKKTANNRSKLADDEIGPRLISVDDNIRTIGGHFFELANLLLSGAQQHGLHPVLATNQSFDPSLSSASWPVTPLFNARRLVHWSLGVDGHSLYRRDGSGHSIGGTSLQNSWVKVTDRIGRIAKRPQVMLDRWADDLAGFLKKIKPTQQDSLLVNTGDDFAMLALAAALRRADLDFPIRLDVIFHFAVYETTSENQDSSEDSQRTRDFGRQINDAITMLQPHDVRLHATTKALAEQIRVAGVGQRITAIPYPTRPRSLSTGSSTERLKIVLAGLPRAEKGRASIAELLAQLEHEHLHAGSFQVSMQMPQNSWQTMVPKSLHSAYEHGLKSSDGPIEVKVANLSTQDYHGWLDTSDIGLFLYDPQRYIARCSGVLLEMMVRGVPVIVPDGCWLADQVRLAGGHRSVGYIYQSRAEIPGLLSEFARDRDKIRRRAIEYASVIAKRHSGENTIREMGIVDDRAAKAA